MSDWTVTSLAPGIWNFNEEAPGTAVDAYLVCGSQRAVMIDALQDARGVYHKVRELTSLPVELLLTHGHYDHAGPAVEEFYQAGCPVWMQEDDVPVLGTMGGRGLPAEFFRPLEDGQVFDLGGRALKTLLLPGHTPGSAVFLDEEDQLAFSGDSIGSGPFWLQLAHSLSVAEFLPNAKRFWEAVEGWEHLRIYPGHQNQSPEPLGKEYLRDVIATAQGILSGALAGPVETMVAGGQSLPYAVVAQGKMLGFFYSPNRIR